MTASDKKYHYTQHQLSEAMKTVGLKQGDVVFTHSSIGFLGYPRQVQNASGICRVIFDAFFAVLGKEGTLVVPTFTYSFPQEKDFDLENTPSTVGMFSEYVRCLPGSFRSSDPIFSVSAIGAKSGDITKDVSRECFGLGSVWERLYNLNAAFMNIGIDVGSTFIHYIEQRLKVPYRYKRLFAGYLIEGSQKKRSGVVHFARDLTYRAATPDFTKLAQDARESGLAKIIPIGKSEINMIRAREMFELCRQKLKVDPSYLVEGVAKEKVRKDNKSVDLPTGSTMMQIIKALEKLPRDIVSGGYQTALESLTHIVNMQISSFPTGWECWGLIIPEEWVCYEAYLESLDGQKIIDYRDNHLHCMSYSSCFEGEVTKEELFKRLYTHPQLNGVVPCYNSIYEKKWGLCCSRQTKNSLTEEKYKVKIRTAFFCGELKVAELILPGETEESIIFSADLSCSRILDDDLTGVAVIMEVMRRVKEVRHFTYQFLLLPGAIGALAWLKRNEDLISHIRGWFCLERLGFAGPYLVSPCDCSSIAAKKGLIETFSSIEPDTVVGKPRNFSGGYREHIDLRGLTLPVLFISRLSPYEQGKECNLDYDNKSQISEKNVSEASQAVLKLIEYLERNRGLISRAGIN